MVGIIAAVVTAVVAYAIPAVTISALISTFVFVASVVIRQNAATSARQQQVQQQQAAPQEADFARGISIVTEGEMVPLVIPYGRNLVGGAKVYYNTRHGCAIAAPNTSDGQYFLASGNLTSEMGGDSHEFLFVQQAVCFSGISHCWAVDIDDRRMSGEYVNAFNEVVYDGTGTYVNPYEYGARAHFYPTGGTADALMTLNDSSRTNARFTNTAYATCVYRMNKTDPQYSGAPSSKFYIEGMKVADVEGTLGARTISSTKTYSNNPARCLLDYLTNPLYGRGLTAASLDLDSFYKAIALCERVVQANVPLEGGLWRAKPSGTQRDIKLYECNLALDSAKPIRDNVETILETMPLSELVWSGGKYKLQLRAPLVYAVGSYAINDEVQYESGGVVGLYTSLIAANTHTPAIGSFWSDAVTAYVTDDDIVREGETSIAWPNAGTRLNFATVRYLNEAIDFKETTATWPPKSGAVYTTYLAEDNGALLETEVFGTGITSSYSALAKAEQLVRQSRVAVTYEMALGRDFIHLEPGDIIKVTSTVLNIPGELLRVNSVTPDSSAGIIKISMTKFDANTLAWNTKDDEVVPSRNLYNNDLPNVSLASMAVAFDAITGVSNLTWTAVSDDRVTSYTVVATTNYIGADTVWSDLGTVTLPQFNIPNMFSSDYYVSVVARTSSNRKAPKSGWPVKTVIYAPPTSVTGLTVASTIDGLLVSWNPTGDSRLSHYEIREKSSPANPAIVAWVETAEESWTSGTYLGKAHTTFIAASSASKGAKIFAVKAVDVNGVYSSTPAVIVKGILPPAQPSLTQSVIDNNVMLYWQNAATTQTIASYEVKRGDFYDTATLLGSKTGLFMSLFETVGGTYTYWVTAVDIAGNRGDPGSITLFVNEPPDYTLRNSVDSSLYGETYRTYASSLMTYDSNYVDMTYLEQDYTKVRLEIATGGYYEEIIDFGSGSTLSIVSSNISAVATSVVASGTASMTLYISYAPDSLVFSSPAVGPSVNGYTFRYVKVRMEVGGTGSVYVSSLLVKLANKEKSEAGRIACYAADTGGTTVTLTKTYIDVTSIMLTVGGTTPLTAVYDFTDAPNPTSFKILLFDNTGARSDGTASYVVTGIT